MKLLCEHCRREIAKIYRKRLQIPLDHTMFDSKDYERGYPHPFRGVMDWLDFHCPYCMRRPMISQFKIMTDEGWVDLSTEEDKIKLMCQQYAKKQRKSAKKRVVKS